MHLDDKNDGGAGGCDEVGNKNEDTCLDALFYKVAKRGINVKNRLYFCIFCVFCLADWKKKAIFADTK